MKARMIVIHGACGRAVGLVKPSHLLAFIAGDTRRLMRIHGYRECFSPRLNALLGTAL